MKDQTPSRTAALVAFFRGIARFLPPDAQLVSDPFGVRFAGAAAERAVALMDRAPALTGRVIDALEPRANVLWMQLRTYAIDEALREFARDGGTQVLLLGAGFDCRAARLVDELPGVTFFEVDHPATQGRKRQVMQAANARSAPVHYVEWHFEREALSGLPARLASVGHDRQQPTLTVWEGVTMYLSEPAIDATLSAVRELSARRSRLVFTYMDRKYLRSDNLSRRFVTAVGEPWTFGWDPSELEAFLTQRGFSLLADHEMATLARRWLPSRYHQKLSQPGRHVAIAQLAE